MLAQPFLGFKLGSELAIQPEITKIQKLGDSEGCIPNRTLSGVGFRV